MIVVGIYIKNPSTLEFERVELFNDEKISVTSTIQNINNIGATYSDFSQTFTVPASKNNNRIFKHWYENSLTSQFDTLKKSDAYIELDTIPFRVGKIQLEGCDVKQNYPQSYSITFIGNLGNLKDKFAGLFLKDLSSTEFNESHNGTIVRDKIFSTAVSGDVMYPLISSLNYWTYGGGYDINVATTPIYYNDLFPALRVKSIFKMIETEFGVSFTGAFLDDNRFKAAYLWLKNADVFTIKGTPDLITWDSTADDYGYSVDLDTESFQVITTGDIIVDRYATLTVTPTEANKIYYVKTFRNGVEILSQQRVSIIGAQTLTISGIGFGLPGDIYTVNSVCVGLGISFVSSFVGVVGTDSPLCQRYNSTLPPIWSISSILIKYGLLLFIIFIYLISFNVNFKNVSKSKPYFSAIVSSKLLYSISNALLKNFVSGVPVVFMDRVILATIIFRFVNCPPLLLIPCNPFLTTHLSIAAIFAFAL